MHCKNLKKFILKPAHKLINAVKVTNTIGIAFVTDDSEKLVGIITDGDVRRAALRGYSLETEVREVFNKDYYYAFEGTTDQEILARIPKKVLIIPIVNNAGIMQGYKFYSELSGKNALITGITGQDGAYLAEFLLSKEYNVYGTFRRVSNLDFSRLEYLNIKEKINLIPVDLLDPGSVYSAIKQSSPSEVYNLAAQSFVQTSFTQPQLTFKINTVGTNNILEALRYFSQNTKFYQASSSEMYGKVAEIPQNEKTPFYPRSPYAVSKLSSYWLTVNYREAYGIYGCNGILFNHESPLRGEEFVTRKITLGAAKIKHGQMKKLGLGNLNAKRDWGYAKDYVECMWLMLQQEEPDDYVIATGKNYSVREFAEKTFDRLDLDYRDYVDVNLDSFRPAEVELLIGDPSKAKEKLGWNPEKTSLDQLIDIMLESDLKSVEKGL